MMSVKRSIFSSTFLRLFEVKDVYQKNNSKVWNTLDVRSSALLYACGFDRSNIRLQGSLSLIPHIVGEKIKIYHLCIYSCTLSFHWECNSIYAIFILLKELQYHISFDRNLQKQCIMKASAFQIYEDFVQSFGWIYTCSTEFLSLNVNNL